MTRKMVAALQVSLDGYTQGSDRGGEEWVDSWADALGLVPEVDALVQGAGMYPGYGDYWAAIQASPYAVTPFQARLPYEREVADAQLAANTPHYVLSKPSSKSPGRYTCASLRMAVGYTTPLVTPPFITTSQKRSLGTGSDN